MLHRLPRPAQVTRVQNMTPPHRVELRLKFLPRILRDRSRHARIRVGHFLEVVELLSVSNCIPEPFICASELVVRRAHPLEFTRRQRRVPRVALHSTLEGERPV